jgi:phytoene desaturase
MGDFVLLFTLFKGNFKKAILFFNFYYIILYRTMQKGGIMLKKVAVIGAGVAGLACAIRLQKDGYDVEIFEKDSFPGGKMNTISSAGFTFDVGPTIVMMPDVYREVFEYAGKNPDDYIPMQQLDPIYSIQFSDGQKYDVSTDMAHLTGFLEKISMKETLGYYKYLSKTYSRYLNAKENFIERSFRGPTDFYNPKTIVNALKLKTFNTAHNEVAKYVKDERLQKLLSFQTLYIGISPYNGPSIYTIIPMIESIYGVWFIKGGMFTMAKAMASLFEELGGKINYNCAVEEVLIQNGKSGGISVDQQKIKSDYVVCNADFPYAMKNLIKESTYKGKYTDKKIDSMKYSCSVVLMYLGLKKKIDGLKVHNIIFADDFDRNISDIFQGNDPKDPSIYIYASTKADSSLAPQNKEALYVLVPVPDLSARKKRWTDEEISEYKKVIFSKMKKIDGLKDIENLVEYEKIYTLNDFESRFNAYNGATFGLAPTLGQSNYFRPHNKFMSTENLYFCGSSVHPGAGVPIVLTSAKLAAAELRRDAGSL